MGMRRQGVEEQFYFLFPALVVFAYGKRVSARPLELPCARSGSTCHPRTVLLISSFISLLISFIWTKNVQTLAFYCSVQRRSIPCSIGHYSAMYPLYPSEPRVVPIRQQCACSPRS